MALVSHPHDISSPKARDPHPCLSTPINFSLSFSCLPLVHISSLFSSIWNHLLIVRLDNRQHGSNGSSLTPWIMILVLCTRYYLMIHALVADNYHCIFSYDSCKMTPGLLLYISYWFLLLWICNTEIMLSIPYIYLVLFFFLNISRFFYFYIWQHIRFKLGIMRNIKE